ncbi:MAG TPA: flagellar hook-associated protein FlgK [Microthrixaceae bacterium]|nr:flagellar hook-associated protein FlgK [Microthrixaceae bacterium]
MSSFGALTTALSGLLTHRRALDVVGHNIANVDTAGYSRRRADLTAAGQSVVPALWARSTSTGNGVAVEGITRIRDEFLERQAYSAHGAASRLRVEAQQLGRIEQTLPEPSDVGLAAQLNDFWAGWDDVANNPGSMAGRIAVLQHGATVASSLNRVDAELRDLRSSALGELESLIAEVNSMAANIAELNGAVSRAVAAGLDPHDLSDQRDELVLQLSKKIGIETRPGEHGTVDVLLGGSSLVRGTKAQALQVTEPEPLGPPHAGTGLDRVEVQWAIDGYPASVRSGEAAGLLETLNEHVPRAIGELDAVAAAMVATVNALHSAGQGLDPVADVNLTFWDPAGTTAATIRISADVEGQPSRIAAAAAGAGALDASVAQQIAQLFADPAGPNAAYETMIGRLAVQTQSTARRSDIQQDVALRADDQRLSVSGVNLDEELTALIASQRAYEASARLMTAVDEALDTLVNRTGLVGR